MNKIYTWLAYKLNEWEGHRLQQEYYNNLVIKRIIFIVFNSFYSLFYIAFIDNRTDYEDNTVRLEALRMQLIILFFMAIIYQNSLEILFPMCLPKIKVCFSCISCRIHTAFCYVISVIYSRKYIFHVLCMLYIIHRNAVEVESMLMRMLNL